MSVPDADFELVAEERAAARAFVARSEVRLSTFHRIAVGMLSGAGLLVVLPVVARDSVTGILRSLLVGHVSLSDGFLIAAVGAVLGVPASALWLLFADLTRFYFHANHIGDQGKSLFTPRFTLTALQLPSDELGISASAELQRTRLHPRNIELLVPSNEAARERIDKQLTAYGKLAAKSSDESRAQGLFELAASKSRPLLDEVAKIEHGMARHVLRLRGLVLRYVKALLALLTTALAIYAGDAIVAALGAREEMSDTGIFWLAIVIAVWAPMVVLAVKSPVRWIESLMKGDDTPSHALARDPELTYVERVSLWIAGFGWLAAATAILLSIVPATASSAMRGAGGAVIGVSAVVLVLAILSGRLRGAE